MSCNNSVVLSSRLSRWVSISENERNCFDSSWPWGKRKSRLLWLDGIFPKSYYFLHCGSVLTVADSRTQKLNSDKFDQWRIRRRMWRNKCMYRRSFSHKVTTRRFCPQHPTLTPGAGSKTEVGPSIPIYIYIYIYIYRDRKPSQHVTVGLAPIIVWIPLPLLKFSPHRDGELSLSKIVRYRNKSGLQ